MKISFNPLWLMIFACFALTSCNGLGSGEERDEALLYGKWLLTLENGRTPENQSTGLDKEEYWIYNSGGTGKTWDASEDITEAEAQPFTWTLVRSELTQIHVTQMAPGGTRADIPKVYEVTELTATTLSYENDYDSYTFQKQ